MFSGKQLDKGEIPKDLQNKSGFMPIREVQSG